MPDPIFLAGDGGPRKKKGYFMRFIGYFWRLKSDKAASENDEVLNIHQTFKEIVIYAIFLIFVCIIAFQMASTNMFYYTKVMMELFLETEVEGVKFKDITTVDSFWKFALGAFLEGLYWTTWYNGNVNPPFDGLIYYENKLLGPPRIRQIRVTTNSCEVNPEFKSFITECFAEYHEDYEDQRFFGTNSTASTTGDDTIDAWGWRSQDVLNGIDYWGKLTSYGAGGYALDLKLSKDDTKNMLTSLKQHLWIRRGSRAVFLSFTVYNANVNLFCVIRLCVEFPATGGAEPSWSFDTVKLLRYSNTNDYMVMVCEIFFMVFIFYYFVEEVIEIVYVGYMYFFDFWNLLDLLIILLAVVCTCLDLWRVTKIKVLLDTYKQTKDKYQNFEYIGFLEARFNNCLAILVFFAWVKVFKYISFNKTMTQLSTTLNRCAKDLLGFLIMFAIVFVAFTQLGYLLFGTQVDDFSTFLNSFFTLFRIILGDFDFHQLEQANRVLGPIFFMLFVFFVFFVLINMFLAIINDTYSEVKSDMAKQVDVFIMSDYLKQRANKFYEKFMSTKEKAEGIELFLQAERGNQRLSFTDWKDELLKQGYDGDEIEELFEKYDVDKDRSLDPAEQKKMLEELEKHREMMKKKKEAAEKDDFDDEAMKDTGQVVSTEFMIMTRRVERLEAAVATMIASIDSVLIQFKGNKG